MTQTGGNAAVGGDMRSTTRNLIVGSLGLATAAGAVAWSAGRATADAVLAPAPSSLAVVDTLTLVQQLLLTDDYAPAREEQAAQIQAQLGAMQEDLQVLQTELQSANPQDPTAQQKYQQFQQRLQAFQQAQQQQGAAFNAFSATQAVEVYGRIRDAVDAVAEREGYTHVIASRLDADIDLTNENATLATVTQEILARPLLGGVKVNDITAAVRSELGLPEPSADDAADEAADSTESDG